MIMIIITIYYILIWEKIISESAPITFLQPAGNPYAIISFISQKTPTLIFRLLRDASDSAFRCRC